MGRLLCALLLALAALASAGAPAASGDQMLERSYRLASEGRVQEAITTLQRMARLHPGDPSPFYHLGMSHKMLGELEAALDAFLACNEMAGEMRGQQALQAAALFHVGVLQHELGDVEDAIETFHEVLELEPDNAGALTNIEIMSEILQEERPRPSPPRRVKRGSRRALPPPPAEAPGYELDQDMRCPPQLGFAPKARPYLVALASMPGCGNTWVRHLLEVASGRYTSSVYNDEKLAALGFQEDYVHGNVLAIKTHDYGDPVSLDFDRVIHLVRNPWRAMLAEFHRRSNPNQEHTGRATKHHFESDAWPAYVEKQTKFWEEHTKFWLERGVPHLLVTFEDVKENPTREVERMLRFLGEPGNPACRAPRKGIKRKSRAEDMAELFPMAMNYSMRVHLQPVFELLEVDY